MYGEEGLKGGLAGLLIGYAFQITGALNSLIVVTATLEGGMAAVQRIEEYEDLPQVPQVTAKVGWCFIFQKKNLNRKFKHLFCVIMSFNWINIGEKLQ